jgi:hypothetical protein
MLKKITWQTINTYSKIYDCPETALVTAEWAVENDHQFAVKNATLESSELIVGTIGSEELGSEETERLIKEFNAGIHDDHS